MGCFNPQPPRKEAETIIFVAVTKIQRFNPQPPRKEAETRGAFKIIGLRILGFNPQPPRKEAETQDIFYDYDQTYGFNPQPPRKEAETRIKAVVVRPILFQSSAPTISRADPVSILSPLERRLKLW